MTMWPEGIIQRPKQQGSWRILLALPCTHAQPYHIQTLHKAPFQSLSHCSKINTMKTTHDIPPKCSYQLNS